MTRTVRPMARVGRMGKPAAHAAVGIRRALARWPRLEMQVGPTAAPVWGTRAEAEVVEVRFR
ncbi:MAG TPA: hypothetical protein VN965_08225 [Candidatus Dormibacteraeota bacterium]|nr:hypothetical protein [Candidatus Dormibacteraeota bacterium]